MSDKSIDFSVDPMEQKIINEIDSHKNEIIEFARDIFSHGELGYKEFRTSKIFSEKLEKLGLKIEKNLAITGVKGHLNENKDFTLSLIGELDALRIPNHPNFNEETQGVHACGHHAQLAGVLGAAIALSIPDVAEKLDGHIEFFAVPAEEYGEIAFKNNLAKEGKIRYGGGKCELIRTGAFDKAALCIAHHTKSDENNSSDILLGDGTGNGFVSKTVRYIGKAAHAAGCPEKGINALNAASIGLQALAFQRETFRDEDCVRVHPILTKGGDLVNVVPEIAEIETLVRAKNIEAINDANEKTDRAFKSGADAIGAGYEIITAPGYLPTIPSPSNEALNRAAKIASVSSEKEYSVSESDINFHSGGSTDLGDLDHLKPVIKFKTGGAKGGLHTSEFCLVDEELAYIVTAKIFALTAYYLLKDGAKLGKKIANDFKPKLTKEEYLNFMESQLKTETNLSRKVESVAEVRKAARQFAMQFFHFSKVLYERYGLETAKDIIRETVFNLAVDRSDQMREKAKNLGKETKTVKDFMNVIDLPFTGWLPELKEDHCPYAVEWRKYIKSYPWFKEIAPFYCDVIDTTTIENFSKHLSHKITNNVILGGTECTREYFESEKVKKGEYTYGEKHKS